MDSIMQCLKSGQRGPKDLKFFSNVLHELSLILLFTILNPLKKKRKVFSSQFKRWNGSHSQQSQFNHLGNQRGKHSAQGEPEFRLPGPPSPPFPDTPIPTHSSGKRTFFKQLILISPMALSKNGTNRAGDYLISFNDWSIQTGLLTVTGYYH